MKIDMIQKVLILGAGTMGRQIGLQCALHGYDTVIYDILPEALQAAKKQIEFYLKEFVVAGAMTETEAAGVLARISTTDDAVHAAKEADLLSESVPEQVKLKGQILGQFNQLCPARTLFTTNSSSLVPSQFAAATGRPDRFCALHFHQPVWSANVVDIMPHPGTAPETVKTVHAFARSIDQIPIVIKKEHPAYVFNTMLDAVLSSALDLAVEDVATIEDIDRAWMGVTKMPIGPFGIIDLVGIDLAYEITAQKLKKVAFMPKARRVIKLLKDKVDQGQLGVKSGQGFYQYPDPAFEQPDFISGSLPEDKMD